VRNLRISVLIAAAAMLTAAVAVPAATAAHHKKKPKPVKIAFTGAYSGQASTKIDGNTATISATGTGLGKLIGSGSITGAGTADSSQQPCPPFGGTGSIKGAKGTILFKIVPGAKGCGDEGGHTFSLVGYMVVTKATGKLAKAKGQIRFTGTYDHDAGTFSIKLAGTLKK
jgi:hypothetical protein